MGTVSCLERRGEGQNVKRDITLKPRKEGTRPRGDLERILAGIYPEESIARLMKDLGFPNQRKGGNNEEKAERKQMPEVSCETKTL